MIASILSNLVTLDCSVGREGGGGRHCPGAFYAGSLVWPLCFRKPGGPLGNGGSDDLILVCYQSGRRRVPSFIKAHPRSAK